MMGTLERVQPGGGLTAPRARWVLVAICAASAVLLVVLGTRLSFFSDDWTFLMQRPGVESHGGIDTLLAPHNGNMVVVFAVMYKVLTAIFGLGSQVPFRITLAIGVVCLGILVYVLVARRLGPLAGLVAAAIVLFLGPAWEVLLFIGGTNHLDAVVLGLATLVALERETRGLDAVACLLLVLAVSVSNTGVAFLAGATIAVLFRRRWQDLWIPLVPAALYALWWAFYGHRQPTGITATHVEHLPRYAFDAFSIGLAAITGLEHASLPHVIRSGHLLGLLTILGLLVWLATGGRPSPFAWVIAGTLLAFWLLTGAAAIPSRGPVHSRYQFTDAVLLIILGAELSGGVRVPRPVVWLLSALALVAIASNLLILRDSYRYMRVESMYAKADLGALNIAGPRAPPALELTPAVAHDPYLKGVTAARYFAVTREHGAPAIWSAGEIAAAPPAQRWAADSVLASAYRLTPRLGWHGSPAGCTHLAANGPELTLRSARVGIRNPSAATLLIGLSRFAPRGMPTIVGFVPSRSTALVRFPSDSVPTPWRITFRNLGKLAGARVEVCPLGA